MTIDEFLERCIQEDEDAARKLLRWAQEFRLELQSPKLLGTVQIGWGAWPYVERLCRQALDDCEAKRRIVREWRRLKNPQTLADRVHFPSLRVAFDEAMLALAEVYSDRPGYPAGWAL